MTNMAFTAVRKSSAADRGLLISIAAVVIFHAAVIYAINRPYALHASDVISATIPLQAFGFSVTSGQTAIEKKKEVPSLAPGSLAKSSTETPSYQYRMERPAEPLEEISFDDILIHLKGVSGKLIAHILVSKSGVVEDVEIESSELPDEFNAQVALLLKSTAFRAGEVSGKPVASTLRMEISAGLGEKPI